MSVATEKITEIQDQVLDLVARIQEPVVNGIQTVATKAADRLPEVKIPGLGDTVPTADELVSAQFAFGQKLLDNQKQFADAVLTAAKPVRQEVRPHPGRQAGPEGDRRSRPPDPGRLIDGSPPEPSQEERSAAPRRSSLRVLARRISRPACRSPPGPFDAGVTTHLTRRDP